MQFTLNFIASKKLYYDTLLTRVHELKNIKTSEFKYTSGGKYFDDFYCTFSGPYISILSHNRLSLNLIMASPLYYISTTLDTSQ